MRRLATIPLLVLAFACTDNTILQPDPDVNVGATVSPRSDLVFQLLENPVNDDWGELSVTPSGVLHIRHYDFGYDVVGDLVGTQRTVGGVFMVNLIDGKGTASGTFLFNLTAPGTGTFECSFHLLVVDYPVHLQHGKFYSCTGTGDFAGMKMKGSFTNENNPGVGNFDVIAEMW